MLREAQISRLKLASACLYTQDFKVQALVYKHAISNVPLFKISCVREKNNKASRIIYLGLVKCHSTEVYSGTKQNWILPTFLTGFPTEIENSVC